MAKKSCLHNGSENAEYQKKYRLVEKSVKKFSDLNQIVLSVFKLHSLTTSIHINCCTFPFLGHHNLQVYITLNIFLVLLEL